MGDIFLPYKSVKSKKDFFNLPIYKNEKLWNKKWTILSLLMFFVVAVLFVLFVCLLFCCCCFSGHGGSRCMCVCVCGGEG